MILKNIFGKTIEAAKKSAQQMYGDDFLVIEAAEGNENGKAKITIFSDEKNKSGDKPSSGQQASASKQPPAQQQDNAGVKFERSAAAQAPKKASGGEEKLNKLRQYAKQIEKKDFAQHFEARTNGNGTSFRQQDNGTAFDAAPKSNGNGTAAGATTYSRSAVRNAPTPPKTNGKADGEDHKKPKPVIKSVFDNGKQKDNPKGADGKFITHFKQSENSSRKTFRQATTVLPARNDEREVKALHKRFDKLEALLDSALISANLDYASHPAFQQLVHTGITTSVIAGWFGQIIEKGIDPYDQPEQFMNKLAAIIRQALGKNDFDEPQKYMMFVGPSGSGKTSLIMKLSQHPDLMEDKKIAVASVHPQNKKENGAYYTILKPFCEDHELPYFEIKNGKDVNDYMAAWEEFDHVFIDTPSINVEQDNAFRDFWKIRQMLTPLTPFEVHYVVNAALNRFYFRNSSATHHPLQPDYVAITHLDEVSQWGPIIPFLQEMGGNARYTSRGESIPNSLGEFNPQWFAQKILQEN
ncbi:hypothetical protein [Gracilimonas mengyeensis]|uniref:Flagellar biosynthesis GTPase FlhF n=1 Tax=Gracilimonas mengyeensis TaxID=1302730 RepID=A0A521FHK6_9BACT|nr:hypothetical protein [Gracilimonas mengyeensis]SMO95687.1 Flagellar biosynthesis GTPase FlhF [Gracilimonas mengyeensis]